MVKRFGFVQQVSRCRLGDVRVCVRRRRRLLLWLLLLLERVLFLLDLGHQHVVAVFHLSKEREYLYVYEVAPSEWSSGWWSAGSGSSRFAWSCDDDAASERTNETYALSRTSEKALVGYGRTLTPEATRLLSFAPESRCQSNEQLLVTLVCWHTHVHTFTCRQANRGRYGEMPDITHYRELSRVPSFASS